MADLADEGYLSQPHTSAGRVPTEKAFRFYVRSLVAGRMPPGYRRVRAELSGLRDLEERIERSSHILTELTRNVGIAAAMPLAQVLDQVELLPLAEGRVLIILVTRDRMVRNRVVMLRAAGFAGRTGSIRNYVNRNFTGWTLRDARRELLRRMAGRARRLRRSMRKLSGAVPEGAARGTRRPKFTWKAPRIWWASICI